MSIIEITILVLVIISIILNIILLIKLNKPKDSTMDFLERLGRFEVNINKEVIFDEYCSEHKKADDSL